MAQAALATFAVLSFSLSYVHSFSYTVDRITQTRESNQRRQSSLSGLKHASLCPPPNAKRSEEEMTTTETTSVSRSAFLSFTAATALATTLSTSSAAQASIATTDRRPQTNERSSGSAELANTRESSSQISAARPKNGETLEESISGFLSGAAISATKTVVKYPLDTATVRLQMPRTSYSIFNLPMLFEGSFRGISAPLLSNIPAGSVFFAVKDAAKAVLKQNGVSKLLATSLAVAAALPPYWLVRNPSEVVKTRQQAGVEGYGEGTSLVDALKLAMSKNGSDGMLGVGELYTGYWENLLYALPADVIKFVCYDSLSGGRKDLPPLKGAVYGAFSTAVAQLATTPLDVVRNRIMAGEEPSKKEGNSISGGNEEDQDSSKVSYLESFGMIAREEGISTLFAGSSPRVGKAILSGAIQFATYEETKQSVSKLLERK